MLDRISRQKYLVIVGDYLTGYLEVRGIISNNSVKVAKFLEQLIFIR
jgi:hypothetical protein